MKESEKQYFEEILVKAVQVGKQETSGLVDDVTKKVSEAVKEQIQITVNGKIDDIKNHLKNQDIHLKEIDNKLDLLKPVSQAITITRILRKFLIWISPLLPLTGVGVLIKWISNKV